MYNLSSISTDDYDDGISSSSYTNSADKTHSNNYDYRYSLAELSKTYGGLQVNFEDMDRGLI
ncbi:unnamed protein product [Schistosoma turkestanicum]|nr:unnamed protein product [Schistosoma turkestanicum]